MSKMIDESSTKTPEDSKMDLLNRVFFSSKYCHQEKASPLQQIELSI